MEQVLTTPLYKGGDIKTLNVLPEVGKLSNKKPKQGLQVA